MPLRKAMVAAAVIKPGPSPVAKAAVVGSAVKPGPSPVAKAAVVGAGRQARSPALIVSDHESVTR